jgi:hypothetical protein
MTPEGKRVTKLDQILLNGNNIALLVPGGCRMKRSDTGHAVRVNGRRARARAIIPDEFRI